MFVDGFLSFQRIKNNPDPDRVQLQTLVPFEGGFDGHGRDLLE